MKKLTPYYNPLKSLSSVSLKLLGLAFVCVVMMGTSSDLMARALEGQAPSEEMLANPKTQPEGANFSSSPLFQARAFNNLSGNYQQIAKDREARKAFNLQSNEQEMTYYDQNKTMVSKYLFSVGKSHLLEAFRAANRSVREDAARSKREEQNRVASSVKGNRDYTVKVRGSKAKAASAIAKAEGREVRVATDSASTHQDGDSAADAASQVFESVWGVGHNMLESYQRIGFSELGEGRVHYDLQRNCMQVRFLTRIVDSEVNYRFFDSSLPMTGNNGGFGGDRATVSMSRGIAPLSLSTGLSFGVQSKNMGYSLTKQLMGPLSAQYQHTMNFQDAAASNDTFQLNVGLGF